MSSNPYQKSWCSSIKRDSAHNPQEVSSTSDGYRTDLFLTIKFSKKNNAPLRSHLLLLTHQPVWMRSEKGLKSDDSSADLYLV